MERAAAPLFYPHEETMIYFITSHHYEAQPLIAYYKLKKDMNALPFPVFRDNRHRIMLCVSGEGAVNTAAATAFLLSKPLWENLSNKNALYIHIGTVEADKPFDKVCFPNVICEPGNDFTGSGKKNTLYTEALFRLPDFMFSCAWDETEAFYAFSSAAKFLALHQIIILRFCESTFASDTNENLSKSLYWLENIHERLSLIMNDDVFTDEETQKIEEIISRLKLTANMRLQLKKACGLYKINHAHLSEAHLIYMLDQFINDLPTEFPRNKTEGKNTFARLLSFLE